MRQPSPNVELITGALKVDTFYLVSIITPAGISDLLYTTYPRDLTVVGLGTFSANNSISKFDPPVMEKASNREVYKLHFVDSDFSMRSFAESSIIGSRVKVWLGVVNNTGQVIGGAAPDQPLLDLADLLLAFDGVIDNKIYTTSPLEGSNIFTIESTTPMASLKSVSAYMTSKDAVQNLDSTDTAYDFVHKSSSPINLLWGKP